MTQFYLNAAMPARSDFFLKSFLLDTQRPETGPQTQDLFLLVNHAHLIINFVKDSDVQSVSGSREGPLVLSECPEGRLGG